MRICHVIVSLNVGGAEMMLKRLIETHRDSAHYEHVVISLTEIGKIGSQLEKLGVRVIAVGMRTPLSFPIALFRLWRLFLKCKPDIVQTWMYHSDLIGGLSARMAGIKNVIWGVHSTHVQAGEAPITTFIMRVCAALSSRIPRVILTVADVSRKVHIGYGYDARRMVVIPHGINISKLTTTDGQRTFLREQCGFEKQHTVVGTVGRFNPAKDYPNFIRAAKEVALVEPNVRFLLVGSGLDSKNESLRRMLDKSGVRDRFVLLGERNDVEVCLAAMDIFCLSSKSEALPTVIVEAMAKGLACIATDVGDTPTLVGDAGIVVPRENSGALSDGILQLMKMDRCVLNNMRKRAKLHIAKNYTIESTIKKLEALYLSFA